MLENRYRSEFVKADIEMDQVSHTTSMSTFSLDSRFFLSRLLQVSVTVSVTDTVGKWSFYSVLPSFPKRLIRGGSRTISFFVFTTICFYYPSSNYYFWGLNYTKPTPIQLQAVPCIMPERNLIGIAQTVSGETLVFILAMFRHILNQPKLEEIDGPKGEYLRD